MLKGLTTDYDRDTYKSRYEDLKQRALDMTKPSSSKHKPVYITHDPELIENFNSKIVNQKTGEKPKSILIEYYETEFSGGKKFYAITRNEDTVGLFDHLDYMR